MKHMEFPPGTFLEIDSLEGGRTVVMVGADGVTYWDSLRTTGVTPVVIHPVLNPKALGTLVAFIAGARLTKAAHCVMNTLQSRGDVRQNDSLYVMRTLWALAPAVVGDAWVPDDAALKQALDRAAAQEDAALRTAGLAERLVAAAKA